MHAFACAVCGRLCIYNSTRSSETPCIASRERKTIFKTHSHLRDKTAVQLHGGVGHQCERLIWLALEVVANAVKAKEVLSKESQEYRNVKDVCVWCATCIRRVIVSHLIIPYFMIRSFNLQWVE